MMRLPDWPARLVEYIESRRSAPFQWGVHDCCKFSAGAVLALTGVDPSEPWPYTNEIGARRLMAKHGGVEGLVTLALGDPIHPSRAGRGDIIVADLDLGPTAGVCLGRDCAFAAPESGLLLLPREVASKAWKV